MWYPTVYDIREVYDRIAGAEGRPCQIRSEAALNRLVVAPQERGEERQTVSALGIKAAAILRHAIGRKVFEHSNEQTTYALTATFLYRNDFSWEASLEDVKNISPTIREGISLGCLGEWVGARLSRRREGRSGRRILAALNNLATVAERLEGIPKMDRYVSTLDAIGHMICAELESASDPSDRKRQRILMSFPAVKEHWGDVFETERKGGLGKEEDRAGDGPDRPTGGSTSDSGK